MGVVIRIESIDSAGPYSKTRAVEVGVPASVFGEERPDWGLLEAGRACGPSVRADAEERSADSAVPGARSGC